MFMPAAKGSARTPLGPIKDKRPVLKEQYHSNPRLTQYEASRNTFWASVLIIILEVLGLLVSKIWNMSSNFTVRNCILRVLRRSLFLLLPWISCNTIQYQPHQELLWQGKLTAENTEAAVCQRCCPCLSVGNFV